MPNRTFQLESFGITDIGLVREHNEDVWVAYPDSGLFILADGMGGHSAGEIASKEAVEHLYALFKEWNLSPNRPLEEGEAFFAEAFAKVNGWIYEKAEHNEELKGMGTTLCALFLHDRRAVLAHVGDSRIYRFRRGELAQLTEDHSFVAELIALGAMKSSESESFPYKHILTRAMGTHLRVEPTLMSTAIERNDLFMLCTDGMTNCATEEQIARILKRGAPLSRKGQDLIDLAIEQGGSDNITLILVHVHDLP